MNHSILPGNTGLLLGIGGSGMSSLAHILLDMGFVVYGYDKKQTEVTEYLSKRGAFIFPNIDEIEMNKINFVVFSSAINDKNHGIFSEVSKFSIPMFHRSNVLHKIFSLSKSISVAGSHGKTSTTAMITQILEESKKEPSVMIGGDTAVLGKKGGKFGKGEWGVYESDESDGTFLKHKANIRIITNVDNDHLDFYHSLDKLQLAFLEYLSVDQAGTAIVQGQDEGIKFVLNRLLSESFTSYQFSIFATIKKSNSDDQDQLWKQLTNKLGDKFQKVYYTTDSGICTFQLGGKEYSFSLPFSGVHYLTNALSAILATHLIGISPENSISILSKYSGVKRRQEVLGIKAGVKVIDDYGHHPTEIRTVIRSLKEEMNSSGNLVVLFQPHRFTRTSLLQKELAESLESADKLFLLPIYAAGEKLIPGVSAKSISQYLMNHPFVQILAGVPETDTAILATHLNSGDTLLCIGAGNVRDWGIEFLK